MLSTGQINSLICGQISIFCHCFRCHVESQLGNSKQEVKSLCVSGNVFYIDQSQGGGCKIGDQCPVMTDQCLFSHPHTGRETKMRSEVGSQY